MSSKDGYRKDIEFLNQTAEGHAFSKLPQDTYEAWHAVVKGYLPIDRAFFQGSLLGARDRELAVCRLKPKLLLNSQKARESPHWFVCDEQINPYYGNRSGAKKRLAKKTSEGLEYYTIATSNKDYDGYKIGVRAEPEEGKREGKIISKADPVCGGYRLYYMMDSGPKYEVGSPTPSILFGKMALLIFLCGNYLRYQNACLITDSAYGSVEGMCYLSLWGIIWVSSIRIAQRYGFMGVSEIQAAGIEKKKEKKIKQKNRVAAGKEKKKINAEEEKRSMKSDVSS